MSNPIYNPEGDAYKMCEKLVRLGSGEHIANLLVKLNSGYKQYRAIRTIERISVQRYGKICMAPWYAKITRTLHDNVERYGEKANSLSARQIEIIGSELDEYFVDVTVTEELGKL